jgi:uncharacterized protein (TIGR02145 family)
MLSMKQIFIFLFIISVFNSFSQSKRDNLTKVIKQRDSLQIELKLQSQIYLSTIDTLNQIISDLKNEIDKLESKLKSIEEVRMGGQIWMKYNLDVITFRNGDTIPQAQSDEDWQNAGFNKQPAWCYYVLNEGNGLEKSYGKLYNLYAVNDERGLAPEGWHIASDYEWKNLKDYLLTTDYFFEDIFYSNETNFHDRGEFSKKCLKVGFGGWRDVGCGGLGENVYYWLQNDIETNENLRVQIVNIKNKSGELDYLRNYNESILNFDSTSWIMGHYVRCIKD